ncbi:unnamed protein product [Pneumocystis jirovecii]|uniref:Uncharacterized protein n=1 Tax=Pneumocystis jirovecii TaxID=42068 RepID=L0PD98_PNEJI|nr:unnamed protein product [Pneumocystis jirovecii]
MKTVFDPLCSPATEFVKSSPFLDDLESDYIFTQYPPDNLDYTHSNNFEKFLNTDFNRCKYDDEKDIGFFDDFSFLNPTGIHLEANNSIFQLSTLYDIPWTKSIFDKDLMHNDLQKGNASEGEEVSDIYVNLSDSASTNQIFDFSIKDTTERINQLDKKTIENKNIVLDENASGDQKNNPTLSCPSSLTNNISPFFGPSFTCPPTPHISSLIENKLKEPLTSDLELSAESSLKQINTQLGDITSKQLHCNEYEELSQINSFDCNTDTQLINDTFLENYYISDELFLKKRSFQDFSDDIYLSSKISLKKNKSMFPIKNNIYDHTFNSMIQDDSRMLSQSYISPNSTFTFDNNLSSTNYEQITNEKQDYMNASSSMPFEIYLPSTIASWSSPKHNYPVSIASIKNKPSKSINLKDIANLSFINFTERDAEIILNGVAPSGSIKIQNI